MSNSAYYTLHMAMGKRKRYRQATMWVATTELPTAASHPFYARLNQLLGEHGFDDFAEAQCAEFYAEAIGRPSLPPGIYFRLLLIGYVEGLEDALPSFHAPPHVRDHVRAGSKHIRYELLRLTDLAIPQAVESHQHCVLHQIVCRGAVAQVSEPVETHPCASRQNSSASASRSPAPSRRARSASLARVMLGASAKPRRRNERNLPRGAGYCVGRGRTNYYSLGAATRLVLTFIITVAFGR